MKRILVWLVVVVLLLGVVGAVSAGDGFDEYGNNDTARLFVGTCLSWHMGKFNSTEAQAMAYCGDYSYDKLKMNWNAEWDRGNAEGWSDPNGYAGAMTDNLWNGRAGANGSGEVWHYKIKWVGPCPDGADGPNGGYCIWGQFEVLMDQGSDAGHDHWWLARARPAGYGAYQP